MQDGEELLPQPRSHERGPRAQRLRRDLGIGALGLLGAALIASAVAHRGNGGDTGPSPSATSHPLALPAATDFVTLSPTGAAYLPVSAADAVACPPRSECVVRHHVSQPVRDAVAAAFPAAVISAVDAVRMRVPNFGEANWSLQVQASAGNTEILLHVRGLARSDHPKGFSRLRYSGQAINRYEAALGQYYVLVQVITPAAQHQPAGPLEQLAGDGRLFEPW